jgi:bifunctional non-homologous end joining protein LigD
MSVKSVHLACQTGGSSKEYRMTIDEVGGDLYDVNALWGRIGSNLTLTCKAKGVTLEKAEKKYASILKEKLNESPPYVEVTPKDDGQSAATAGSQAAPGTVRAVIARVIPQLCGSLTDKTELEPYLLNDMYVMEEKFNGKRKQVIKSGHNLSITNKQGQTTGVGMLPKTQAEFLKVSFDFAVDTEDEPVGGGCVLLDIVTIGDKPVDRMSGDERREMLEAFYRKAGFDPKVIRLAERVNGQKAKREFLKRLKKAKAEGCIFKNRLAAYIPGEAGRAEWFKHKFQATASCIVDGVMAGGKRSIAIALLDGRKRVSVGKCAIPVNKEVPAKDTVVEIRYIYAEHGSNKLNQPFYLGPRDDVGVNECQISQLKYKQRE